MAIRREERWHRYEAAETVVGYIMRIGGQEWEWGILAE
jgi:hypothetical protein